MRVLRLALVRNLWKTVLWPAAGGCVAASGPRLPPVSAQAAQTRVAAPVCVGLCPRVAGLRIALRDRAVERVDGINVTVWLPHEEGRGRSHGVTLGLPIASSGNVDGLIVALAASQTTDRLQGLGASGLTIGADRPRGALMSGLLTLAGDSRGLLASGGASIATLGAHGVTLGGVAVSAWGGWGAAIGGLGAHAAGGYRGVVVGGFGVVTGAVRGAAFTAGVHYASDFGGISVALVNYARTFRGLQLGAVNVVDDGRSPRLLPLINWR